MDLDVSGTGYRSQALDIARPASEDAQMTQRWVPDLPDVSLYEDQLLAIVHSPTDSWPAHEVISQDINYGDKRFEQLLAKFYKPDTFCF